MISNFSESELKADYQKLNSGKAKTYSLEETDEILEETIKHYENWDSGLFLKKLNRQVAYIASDKPQTALKFKQKLLKQIKTLEHHPLKHRESIYFDDVTRYDFYRIHDRLQNWNW